MSSPAGREAGRPAGQPAQELIYGCMGLGGSWSPEPHSSAHVDEAAVLLSIDPRKDVDGFHPVNVGALWAGRPTLTPCTPAGVMARGDGGG